MTSNEPDEDGPEFQVWNHLWAGIDMATNELRALDDASRAQVEKLGKAIADARSDLVQRPNSFSARVLSVEEYLLANPWIRHAAEIEIAATGIVRAEKALDRFAKVRPAITRRALPPRAAGYVAEVINTFIFGFDAACIALCRATLEQVLKDELVRRGAFTEPQLKREKPTAGTLLSNAFRIGLLQSSRRSAGKLVEKGDTIMHNFVYDERVSEQQALDSVAQLIEVLTEILGPDSSDSPTAT
jgi:hypothetical protein